MKSRASYKEYILDVVFIAIVVQVVRIGIKYILSSQLNLSLTNLIITSIISFIIISTFLVLVLKDNEKYNPSNIKIINMFNNQSQQIRKILLIIFIILLIMYPYFRYGYDFDSIFILILSLIIIPIFEELLFREYLWNYLNNYIKNTIITFISITIIYALFQVGYIDIIKQYLECTNTHNYIIDIVSENILRGLLMGILIGATKIKLKDTSICMLIHGIFSISLIKF